MAPPRRVMVAGRLEGSRLRLLNGGQAVYESQPRCTARLFTGPRHGQVCGRPAKWLVQGRHTTAGPVCGHHARSWVPEVLHPIRVTM